MEKYKVLEMEVIRFDENDVIVTSPSPCPETPCVND